MTTEFLRPVDLAAMLNCNVRTIRRMIHRGDIPACYVTPIGTPGARGCRYRIDPAAVNALRASSSNAEHVAAMEFLVTAGVIPSH